ncbi:MAG: transglutaminase domain-containing protein [Myxococcota bacterium]|nr:transglutaminase domain-containing protein [Myxococcota bacterium]
MVSVSCAKKSVLTSRIRPGPIGTESGDVPTTEKLFCAPPGDNHVIFSIFIDDKEVGREVRTTIEESGPLGQEVVVLSHAVTRMKMGTAHFERREVKEERTRKTDGLILQGSHVTMNQVNFRIFRVGYNGSGWDRLVESKSALTVESTADPTAVSLAEVDVFGMDLSEALRDRALHAEHGLPTKNYYDPVLERPVALFFSKPEPGSIELYGQQIQGSWIEARREGATAAEMRTFFDKKGTLWIEAYPEKSEIRRRLPGPLTLSMETSELLVGLHSEAYLADPNAATHATFLFRSTPQRLDALDLIDVPLNHTVVRKSPTELLLTVEAGAPDGDVPPGKADLKGSRYVLPKSPEIIGALRYLRSAGKRGRLSRERRYNATPVVARAALIQNPKRFWSDADKVAGLIMHYVSALLPDKRHTFSMADAATTLGRGAGDCTEHAVLFAALMRAAGIPTRLVSGMYLTSGGMWGYHMWNAYWNGEMWQSIDPSTMSYRTGAAYIALGSGAAQFDEVRDRLADFIWRTFSGVSIDLIEASNNGERLFLARPKSPDQNLKETALFNAVVLSERGDHEGAIAILDENITSEYRSLSVKLMRVELLVLAGRHDEALRNIVALREETSMAGNVRLLDTFELKCLLTMGEGEKAKKIYERLEKELKKQGKEVARVLLRAEYLFDSNDASAAIDLLDSELEQDPDNASLFTAFAHYVSLSQGDVDTAMFDRALEAARSAVQKTMYAEDRALAALARLLLKGGRLAEAGWFVDHALMLAPAARHLHELKRKINSRHCEVARQNGRLEPSGKEQR